MADLSTYWDRFEALPTWAQQVVQASLVILVTVPLLRLIHYFADDAFEKSPRIDRTLAGFLHPLVDIAGWLIILILVLATFGVNPAALAGVVAAGGFVIGFAVKDTLGNLAAGVMLLMYRPFRVGDEILMGDLKGHVRRLSLALTTVELEDGRMATVPNAKVLGNAIVNASRGAIRRVAVRLHVAYGDDLNQAVLILIRAAKAQPGALEHPPPRVEARGFDDAGTELELQAWFPPDKAGPSKDQLFFQVRRNLHEAGFRVAVTRRAVDVRARGSGNGSHGDGRELLAGGAAEPAPPPSSN